MDHNAADRIHQSLLICILSCRSLMFEAERDLAKSCHGIPGAVASRTLCRRGSRTGQRGLSPVAISCTNDLIGRCCCRRRYAPSSALRSFRDAVDFAMWHLQVKVVRCH